MRNLNGGQEQGTHIRDQLDDPKAIAQLVANEAAGRPERRAAIAHLRRDADCCGPQDSGRLEYERVVACTKRGVYRVSEVVLIL